MSGLFGGGTSRIPNSAAGFNVLTSAYGIAIPLAYGQVRLSSNLIHLPIDVTTAHDTRQRTGKHGGVITTTYTYTAALAMGLCEGPITSVVTLYRAKDVLPWATASAQGYVLFLGTNAQTPWAYLTTNYPGQAVPYELTAYVAHPTMDLPDNQIQDHSWEVQALAQYNPGGGIIDAAPSDVVTDFLTNLDHGAGFPAALLGDFTQFVNYVVATGLFISPIFDTQKAARDWLLDVMAIANTAFVWSDGLLKAVPYGDIAATGNGKTYTPNTTPLYNLTDDDFTTPGVDPIVVTRNELSTAFNSIQVEYMDRGNNYALAIAQATDQASVDTYGLRIAPVLQYHAICQPSIARLVAQLQLQRSLYIRNSYKFNASWKYMLLEPMDLITLTDAGLGLNQTPVRITSVEENDGGDLTFTCEDWPIGTASATLYSTQGGAGSGPNAASDPGNTTAPVIFDVPSALTASALEIWVAAAGGANWGGCDVWFSTDNVTYRKMGSLVGPSTYGVLTATLPTNAAYPPSDVTHTLAIDLTTSAGAVATISASDYAQFMNLSYVGGEFVAFLTAALTSAFKYNLTTLARGLYGTPIANPAPIGANFVKCDGRVFRLAIPQSFVQDGYAGLAVPNPASLVGTTVYFKLPAFNLFGGGLQSLASATAYSHVVGALVGATKIGPPSCWIGTVSRTATVETISFNGKNGAGCLGVLQWRYGIDGAAPGAYVTTALPSNLAVNRAAFYDFTYQLDVLQSDGQTTSYVYKVMGQHPALDPGTGVVKRSIAMTDGNFAVAANDATGQQINRASAIIMGDPAAKRIEGNLTGPGTIVLQVQQGGGVGVKGVVGDYTRPTVAPTAATDSTWTSTTDTITVGPADKSHWRSGTGCVNALSGVSIIAYDNIYKVSFTVGIKDTVMGADFVNGFGRVLIETNVNGAGYVSAGNYGLTMDDGVLNDHTTAAYVVALTIPGVAASLSIRVTAQGEYVEGPSSNTSQVIADLVVTSVDWKYLASGSPLARRGLLLGGEASQPHFSLEPIATAPTAAQAVEGEFWWDGTNHYLSAHDGNAIANYKRYVHLALAADFSNATTAFTDATGLTWPVGANEVWQVEIEGGMLGSASGAVARVTVDQTYTFAHACNSNTTAVGTYAFDTSITVDPVARCTSITGAIKQAWRIVNGATAGNMKVQLKSGAVATSTLKAGLRVSARRIA